VFRFFYQDPYLMSDIAKLTTEAPLASLQLDVFNI